jgi:hypothetical protein
MFVFECRVARQTDGATPLFVASQDGHVECILALLGGGASINQATVSSTSSMARHRGVSCGRRCVDDCVHACVCICLGALGWHLIERLSESSWSTCRTSCHGEHRDSGLQQTCQCGCEAWHDSVDEMCQRECRVALQTGGFTPLYVASYNGHVECVRALLGEGAAINQATVGSACSMTRHREGSVCVLGCTEGSVHPSAACAVWTPLAVGFSWSCVVLSSFNI